MTHDKIRLEELGVTVDYTSLTPEGKVGEWHAALRVDPRGELFPGQLRRLYEAEDALPGLPPFAGARYVTKRYFLSDSANQYPLMRGGGTEAVSVIQQPPLDGSKIAAWVYLQSGTEVTLEKGVTVSAHNGYRHLWKMGMHHGNGNSYTQTECVLADYGEALRSLGASLARDCVRTWFFVRDVDTQYAGMVNARRASFMAQGLTERTHYIASTGIGAVPAQPKAIVQLGAYAVSGLRPGQLRYLQARDHLNPTYEYGVTFERGTVVEYGDRAHVLISGTASINSRGEVVHPGDVVSQTRRMWENVEALLAEAGAGAGDIMQIVVYLRDAADHATVSRMFRERYPDVPTVIALAPVCRPSWLIEMECMAAVERRDEAYPDM